jgi:hypothetical protein
MSPSQKMAWGNVIVWVTYLVVLAIVLAANGTILFWQEDSLKNAFFHNHRGGSRSIHHYAVICLDEGV